MEEYTKNSLLRQLKEKGLAKNDAETDNRLPFGILTGNFEDSPFNLSPSQDNPIKKEPKIIKKHLNMLDNYLFNDSNYLNIDDKELSKSEKIRKIKELIKRADEKISMLEDIGNDEVLNKFKADRQELTNALELLNDENDFNIKDSVEINKHSLKKENLKSKLSRFETFLFKMCPPLYKSYLVKKALHKLKKLSDSAKEICNKELPYYGEKDNRYNDFIACLSCANTINAKLSKKI